MDDYVCSECGSPRATVRDDPKNYRVVYECPDCEEGNSEDGYEDLYGCMSVPWGFLL